jgi:hypothetical protein
LDAALSAPEIKGAFVLKEHRGNTWNNAAEQEGKARGDVVSTKQCVR